jgi:hypothetical protein
MRRMSPRVKNGLKYAWDWTVGLVVGFVPTQDPPAAVTTVPADQAVPRTEKKPRGLSL